ncbi:MAG: Kae1-associated serine/threonine protein kinase [Thermoplasmata archaeon]|nr:Kae1-associated serine/threonine protein kinase [Thermoplasmata archaeon]
MIQGAEATIIEGDFLGRKALIKTRPAKSYRLPELDTHLRSVRTKNEAKIMHDARIAGVRTPCIYDIDLKEFSITMEYIDGPAVKDVLDEHPEMADEICEKIGASVAKIHSAGICHGDLTTSNMIYKDGEVCLIDFSMGCTKAELEDIGVDLRLLERAFSSAHVGLESSFDRLMETYYDNVANAKQVRKKLIDIKNRARYT